MENIKPYEIETENRGDYLYAIVGGLKFMPDMAKDYWQEIIDECDEVGLDKILIEKNFPETFTTKSLAATGPEIIKMLGGKVVAFVDRYGHEDVNELGKVLSHGTEATFRIFDDAETAEKWLRAN
ncbi:MAG: hypothetical protein ACJ72Z_14590 [Pyrinomonadaceae bacterium]